MEYEDKQTVLDKLETHKTVSFNSKSEQIEVKTMMENILLGSVKKKQSSQCIEEEDRFRTI